MQPCSTAYSNTRQSFNPEYYSFSGERAIYYQQTHGTPFAPDENREKSKLYEAIDALNAKLGKGKVFSAAEGVGKPAWAMKRSKLSKRATINWDELLTVR